MADPIAAAVQFAKGSNQGEQPWAMTVHGLLCILIAMCMERMAVDLFSLISDGVYFKSTMPKQKPLVRENTRLPVKDHIRMAYNYLVTLGTDQIGSKSFPIFYLQGRDTIKLSDFCIFMRDFRFAKTAVEYANLLLSSTGATTNTNSVDPLSPFDLLRNRLIMNHPHLLEDDSAILLLIFAFNKTQPTVRQIQHYGSNFGRKKVEWVQEKMEEMEHNIGAGSYGWHDAYQQLEKELKRLYPPSG